MRRYPTVEARLLANSIQPPDSDCWEWLGRLVATRGPNRYGRFNAYIAGRHRSLWAHRVSYEEFRGTIPAGFQVDHLCRNTTCINPAHLEAVEHRENQQRRARARK